MAIKSGFRDNRIICGSMVDEIRLPKGTATSIGTHCAMDLFSILVNSGYIVTVWADATDYHVVATEKPEFVDNKIDSELLEKIKAQKVVLSNG